jgi:DNA-directed RNA polymerase specialized sigma24 family protein
MGRLFGDDMREEFRPDGLACTPVPKERELEIPRGTRRPFPAALPIGSVNAHSVSPRDRRAALQSLMSAHGDAVHSFCLRALAGDRRAADHVLRDVFVNVFVQDLSPVRDRPLPWLLGLASRYCRERLATSGRSVSARGPSSRADDPVEACLAEMTIDARIILLLRFSGQLSREEIGQALDVPVSVVESLLQAALRILSQVGSGCLAHP